MTLFHASALAVAIAALLGAPLQVAAQATSPVEAQFGELDSDHNDALSLDEYVAEARAEFDAIDADRNFSINVEEMDAADPQADGELSSAQKIALRDGNQDGILSVDEYLASIEERFRTIDANSDGSLDLAELKSGAPVRVPAP
jgi:uncharacterized protein YqfA (UPF0365 family)